MFWMHTNGKLENTSFRDCGGWGRAGRGRKNRWASAETTARGNGDARSSLHVGSVEEVHGGKCSKSGSERTSSGI